MTSTPTITLTLTEFVKGPEGTGDEWAEVFQWFSEKREVGADDRKFHPALQPGLFANLATGRKSIDSRRPSQDMRPTSMYSGLEKRGTSPNPMTPPTQFPAVEEQPEPSLSLAADSIPIMVTPASPMGPSPAYSQDHLNGDPRASQPRISGEKQRLSVETARGKPGKKVREVFISGVHKSRARVTTISKKIGHNVGRHNSMHLKRSRSAPGMHLVLHGECSTATNARL